MNRALTTLEKIVADFRNDRGMVACAGGWSARTRRRIAFADGTVIRLQVRTILNRKEEVGREMRRRIKDRLSRSRRFL